MASTQADEEPELRDYLRVLQRRKFSCLLAFVAVLGTALAFSFVQDPVYAATSQILLERRSSETLFDENTGQASDPQRLVQTQIGVLQSKAVRSVVAQNLGYGARISASPKGQTDLINIRAENKDPKRAADIANAYATAYIEFRQKKAVEDVLAAATEVQSKITDLQKQIDVAVPPLRDTLVQQQALFKNKLDQLQLNATLQSGGAQFVDPAEEPTNPIRPRPARAAVLGGMLGILLAMGAAFVIDYLDDSVESKEDLEKAAHPLTVISMIPAVTGWKSKEEATLVSLSEPRSPAAEAYRTLRASIQFMGVDQPLRRIQVTSPTAQEGKTTTLANLGVALARAGKRVVIVCCDLRRPRVHEFFGLSNAVGFTSVLLGEATLQEAVQRVPNVDRLYVLASGPLPPNPSELLQTRRAEEVLGFLQQEESIVLIDSPPVLPVSDALVLATRVDGTLLVCAAGGTTKKQAARAMEMLRTVDAPMIGAVLNRVPATDRAYRYTYGYYQAKTPSVRVNGNGNGSRVEKLRRGKWGKAASTKP